MPLRLTLLCALLTSAVWSFECECESHGNLQRSITLANKGITQYEILVAPNATVQERFAAEELARSLKESTGAEFPIVNKASAGKSSIAVGAGAARLICPKVDLDGLGTEGIRILTHAPHLILSGEENAQRGTLYAVFTFLEDTVGFRWWSSKATHVPKHDKLSLKPQDRRYVPPFEFRDSYFFDARNPAYGMRNRIYAPFADAKHGGAIVWAGPHASHTFYAFVQPDLFEKHPEWFSEIKGKRVKGGHTFNDPPSQLCLTNKAMLAHTIEQVKTWLRKAPPDAWISVSQNDWHSWCECAACTAVAEEEGSQQGPILRYVNAVAEAIEPEFPKVTVQTLAYQYSRKPTRVTRPRHNVVVQLCNIECNFFEPNDHESNKDFMQDLKGWSKLSDRLMIWDYADNFSDFFVPFPNHRAMGPNIKLFHEHNARGVITLGNYVARGGQFQELKQWVLAKLLWDPRRDDKKLIDEFIAGYYGPAAPHIREYFKVLHEAAAKEKIYLKCAGWKTDEKMFTPLLLDSLERIMRKAEASVAAQPELLKRVEVAHLPVRFVYISRWPSLRMAAQADRLPWPFDFDREKAISEFERVCKENEIAKLQEHGEPNVDSLRKRFPGARKVSPALPPDIPELARREWLDVQDDFFSLYKRGELCDFAADEKASDGMAVRLPGDKREWAVSLSPSTLEPRVMEIITGGEWDVYVVARIQRKGKDGEGFISGIYDNHEKKHLGLPGNRAVGEIPDDEYHAYKLGTHQFNKNRFIFMGNPGNGQNVDAVWFDRVILVRPVK